MAVLHLQTLVHKLCEAEGELVTQTRRYLRMLLEDGADVNGPYTLDSLAKNGARAALP